MSSPATVVAAALCLRANSAWASGEVGSTAMLAAGGARGATQMFNTAQALRLDGGRSCGAVRRRRRSRSRGSWRTLRRCVRRSLFRQLAVVLQRLIDQVRAFLAVLTDQ